MPFIWIKEGSNFVAIKFVKSDPAKVEETFATPATTDNLDTELLDYLKGMSVGEAIEFNLKDSGLKTERSLKVRVNKHAKLAKRELDWRVSGGNFMVKVTGIIEDTTPSNNGTTEGATEETSTRARR